MCGRQPPPPMPAQPLAARPAPACQNRQGAQSVGAVAARPIGDFLNKIGEGIFVGTFRGSTLSPALLCSRLCFMLQAEHILFALPPSAVKESAERIPEHPWASLERSGRSLA